MESASTPACVSPPIDLAVLAAASQSAVTALSESADPAQAIDSAVEVLYDGVRGLTLSVFVLEHGRFWLVAQRGH